MRSGVSLCIFVRCLIGWLIFCLFGLLKCVWLVGCCSVKVVFVCGVGFLLDKEFGMLDVIFFSCLFFSIYLFFVGDGSFVEVIVIIWFGIGVGD